jgi:hypothetical protein
MKEKKRGRRFTDKANKEQQRKKKKNSTTEEGMTSLIESKNANSKPAQAHPATEEEKKTESREKWGDKKCPLLRNGVEKTRYHPASLCEYVVFFL